MTKLEKIILAMAFAYWLFAIYMVIRLYRKALSKANLQIQELQQRFVGGHA